MKGININRVQSGLFDKETERSQSIYQKKFIGVKSSLAAVVMDDTNDQQA